MNWRPQAIGDFDCEFGFSCMGYEIAGGLGARLADNTREVFVLVGDGSYLMMNSDILSSVMTKQKLIIVICDNGGYAVINRLQNFKGAASFNNLFADCHQTEPVTIDFVAHAKSLAPTAKKPTTWNPCNKPSPVPNAPPTPTSSASAATPTAGPQTTSGGMSACLKKATKPASAKRDKRTKKAAKSNAPAYKPCPATSSASPSPPLLGATTTCPPSAATPPSTPSSANPAPPASAAPNSAAPSHATPPK